MLIDKSTNKREQEIAPMDYHLHLQKIFSFFPYLVLRHFVASEHDADAHVVVETKQTVGLHLKCDIAKLA
jgi:hypothetical protein